MDPRLRKNLMQKNIYQCKFGDYKRIPEGRSVKSFYTDNFQVAPPYQYGNVEVVTAHPIDAAYEFVKMGCRPSIVNTVSEDFMASNLDTCEGFKDPMINIRTSYCRTVAGFNLFPLNGPEVVTAPSSYIIRGPDLNMLHPNNVIKVGIITVPLKEIDKKFDFNSYINTSQLYEAVFQAAISSGADTIILNDMGAKTNGYQMNDVVRMVNNCIFKYGHMFKNIVVALNCRSHADMGYDAKFKKELIFPQRFIGEYIQKEQQTADDLLHNLNSQIDSHINGTEDNDLALLSRLAENNN